MNTLEFFRVKVCLLISVNIAVRNSDNYYSMTGALLDEEMKTEVLAPLCRASYPSRLGMCKQLRECLGGGGRYHGFCSDNAGVCCIGKIIFFNNFIWNRINAIYFNLLFERIFS